MKATVIAISSLREEHLIKLLNEAGCTEVQVIQESEVSTSTLDSESLGDIVIIDHDSEIVDLILKEPLRGLRGFSTIIALGGEGKAEGSLLSLRPDAFISMSSEEQDIMNDIMQISYEVQERIRQRDGSENLARLKALVDSTDDVLFILDREQRHLEVFGRWLERFHEMKDMYIGRTSREILGEEAATIHEEHNLQALNGKHVSYEWAVPTNEGIQHFMTALSPIKDANGDVQGIAGIARNITDRVVAEQNLKDNEQLLEAILRNVPEYILIYDDMGRIRYVNHNILDHLGYGGDPVGMDALEMIFEEDIESARLFMQKRIAGEDIPGYEIRLGKADGGVVNMMVLGSRLVVGDETLHILTMSDLTKIKEAESRFEQSEAGFRRVFDNMPLSVLVHEKDTLDIVYANQKFISNCGFNGLDELKDNGIVWAEPPYSSVEAAEKVKLAVEEGPQTFQWLGMRKDGTPYWELISLIPIPFDGKDRLLSLSIDIDEMKKMEMSLNTLNEKLQLLSGIIRHDINNKLIGLRGYLDLAMGSEGVEASKFLEKAETIASTIQRDIDFMRDYEKIGILKPEWQRINPSLSAARVCGVEVGIDLSGIEIYADPMFERVLDNLVDNSLRHGERVERIALYSRRMGQYLAIIYEDDGVGISSEDKQGIFQRNVGRNTGYGLFYSRQVLALTGITIEEDGSDGARFIICVPPGHWRKTEDD